MNRINEKKEKPSFLSYFSNLLVPHLNRAKDFRARLLIIIAVVTTVALALNVIPYAGSYSGMYFGGYCKGFCVDEALLGFPWPITIRGLAHGPNPAQLGPYILVGNLLCNFLFFAFLTVVWLRLFTSRIYLSQWILLCLTISLWFAALTCRLVDPVSFGTSDGPLSTIRKPPYSTGTLIHNIAFDLLTGCIVLVVLFRLASLIAARLRVRTSRVANNQS
jgi:hypothetical protein